MLKKLHIENFVTIDNITINFYDGLSIITGETGAGKSLMIDSLSLLLGERASLDMIRQGEEKAYIEAEFQENNQFLKAFLNKLGIFDTEKIIIKRTISQTKSIVKINDVNVSVNDLKTVGSLLADIHLQFEVTKIFDNENYLGIIDGFKSDLIEEYVKKYNDSLDELIIEKKKYEDLLNRQAEVEKNREDLLDELKEIEARNIYVGCEKDLEDKISLLLNYDKIYELSEKTKLIIDEKGLDDLYQIKENVSSLSEYQNEYQDSANQLEDLYIQIDDLLRETRRKFDGIEYNPDELEQLQNDLYDLKALKKKFKLDEQGLLDRLNELKALLINKEDYEVLIQDEKKKYEALFDKTYSLANDISLIRKDVAKMVEKEMMSHLKDLGLQANFKIDIVSSTKSEDISLFTARGIDKVDFFIETNVGEGLKPLGKVVSGGEASRIMLALKIIYLKSRKIKTIIFDEVDVGISGKIANLVANKLYELSLDNQVIAISHLPQVARNANTHYRIEKIVKDNRTKTNVKELSFDERIREIATLISDGKITDKQIEYAKELLTNRELKQ